MSRIEITPTTEAILAEHYNDYCGRTRKWEDIPAEVRPELISMMFEQMVKISGDEGNLIEDYADEDILNF